MKKSAVFFAVGAVATAWASASYAADSTLTVSFTSPGSVPALSPAAVVMMVLGLGAIALVSLRRRHAPRLMMIAGGLVVLGLSLFAAPTAQAITTGIPVSVTGTPTVVDLTTNGPGHFMLTNNTGATILISSTTIDNENGDSFSINGASPCGVTTSVAPGKVCEIDIDEPA